MTAAELQARIEQRGVHAVFGAYGDGWGIEQSPAELAAFLARMSDLQVTSVLEIGTGHKAGLARFMAHELGWQVVSLDVVDYGHVINGVEFLNRNVFKLPKLLRYDLLFIDGNHNYEAVKHDYERCGHLANKVIAFHDIAGYRECEGARDYWREIAYNGDTLCAGYHEVIDAANGAGIGWIEL